MARRPGEAVRSISRRARIHPTTEALIRCRDGELPEVQRRATEAHLEGCANCQLEYHRLCQELKQAASPAPVPDAELFSSLLNHIGHWEQTQAETDQTGEAVKQRIASDVKPFLGTGATDQILQSAGEGSENLLAAVESVSRAFLGKRTAAELVSGTVDRAVYLKGSPRKSEESWTRGSIRGLGRTVPRNMARNILLAAVGSLLLGLAAFAAWWTTGTVGWMGELLRLPGSLVAVGVGTIELWFSVRVIRQFAPGEAIRTVWILVAASAACNLSSALLAEVVALRTEDAGVAAGSALSQWREAGLTVGGTYRFALLAAALYCGLKVFRQSGFLARLRASDWLLLAIPACFVVLKLTDLLRGPAAGQLPDMWTAQRWLVDPILWLLLGHGLLLFRSMQRMGLGWISRCWGCYCAGVFLTSLGDFALWTAQHGYLPGPLISLAWCAWLPAVAALALAPAYQLEAIRFAGGSEKR